MNNEFKKKLSQIQKIADAQMADYEANKEKYQQERENEAKANKNCLTYWFPLIKDLPGILTPKTKIYPLHFSEQLRLLDNKTSNAVALVIEQMKQDSLELGVPFFLKNSLFSGKHQWQETCFVSDLSKLQSHIHTLTDFAYCVGCGDSLYLIARTIIPTLAPFTAFNGMPVTKERRYFIKDGQVVFHQPYWPPHSMQDPSINNWEEELTKLNHESAEEISHLKSLAEVVAKALPGYWSADFLQGSDGKWYLIDMAEGQRSFLWKDYPLGTVGL